MANLSNFSDFSNLTTTSAVTLGETVFSLTTLFSFTSTDSTFVTTTALNPLLNDSDKINVTEFPIFTEKVFNNFTEISNVTISTSTLQNISGYANASDDDDCSEVSGYCEDGIIIPQWNPPPALITTSERAGRVVVYLLALIYLFLGLTMTINSLVEVIEVIISKKRKVKVVSRLTGNSTFVLIPIWNQTVAHLTLLALSNCAPEIFLVIIETLSRSLKIGYLGAGTIIGAGAYNMFIITGICCLSVPAGKTLRLIHLPVFILTAFWMLFAYVWLYLIIAVISEGVIEIWEALITLLLYPICVASAYLTERECFGRLDPMIKKVKNRISPQTTQQPRSRSNGVDKKRFDKVEIARTALEKREKRFLQILADFRKRYPKLTSRQHREMAELELLKEDPKSRNYYRMAVSHRVTGNAVINKKKLKIKRADKQVKKENKVDSKTQTFSFEQPSYSVMENAGVFGLDVIREGGNLKIGTCIDYETREGTGKIDVDFKATSGTLIFEPNESRKTIEVEMIDDEEYTENKVFFVAISNPRIDKSKGPVQTAFYAFYMMNFAIDNDGIAQVNKIDDDHGGVFSFAAPQCLVQESCGVTNIKITRSFGAKGDVILPIKVTAKSATVAVDYEEPTMESVSFVHGNTMAEFPIRIIDHSNLASKRVTLEVTLDEPEWSSSFDTSKMAKPRLGEYMTMTIVITDNPELKNAVSDIGMSAMSDYLGSSSWKSQFTQAIQVPTNKSNSGDGDSNFDDVFTDESNQQAATSTKTNRPGWRNYVSHVITLFWKLLLACIPPPDLAYGVPCFILCLCLIGLLVILILDLAMYFGCTAGAKDVIVGIIIVALGTSLPDMFASRIAVQRETAADAAIGHITGSCAVNVFGALGISFTISSIYQKVANDKSGSLVDADELSFHVVLFFIFATVAIAILMVRRHKPIRGELGGNLAPKLGTSIAFWILWLIYVILAVLKSFCVIDQF